MHSFYCRRLTWLAGRGHKRAGKAAQPTPRGPFGDDLVPVGRPGVGTATGNGFSATESLACLPAADLTLSIAGCAHQDQIGRQGCDLVGWHEGHLALDAPGRADEMGLLADFKEEGDRVAAIFGQDGQVLDQ